MFLRVPGLFRYLIMRVPGNSFFFLILWVPTVMILSFRTDMPGQTVFAIPFASFELITLW